jgi:hypothetical protein
VWFTDGYSLKRVYTHDSPFGNNWIGFSHGGTLRHLVIEFRDYIRTGKQVSPWYLGPERFGQENIWGYDDHGMKAVREQAGALPVFRQPVAAAA